MLPKITHLEKISPIERSIELLVEHRKQIELEIKELRALLPMKKRKRRMGKVKVFLAGKEWEFDIE